MGRAPDDAHDIATRGHMQQVRAPVLHQMTPHICRGFCRLPRGEQLRLAERRTANTIDEFQVHDSELLSSGSSAVPWPQEWLERVGNGPESG